MTSNEKKIASFEVETEAEIAEEFLKNGYLISPVEDLKSLQRIRDMLVAIVVDKLKLDHPTDSGDFLNLIHQRVDPSQLNKLRLDTFNQINREPWFRPAYYSLVRNKLSAIVGNELAMQLRVNLSIQMPDDKSSLLPLHADVWNGDSPYEVVVWVPLVDVYNTKSMYILPASKNKIWERELSNYSGARASQLFDAVKGDLEFLSMRFGDVMIFSQNQMHGNNINEEPETRWSMNCRFKSLFSPYADKKLGEFFEPITIKPATRLGAGYKFPMSDNV
tara:strand:- start:205 stop:1032 length:828 start_codon:yes stop_codon:yes gene_type:complete